MSGRSILFTLVRRSAALRGKSRIVMDDSAEPVNRSNQHLAAVQRAA